MKNRLVALLLVGVLALFGTNISPVAAEINDLESGDAIVQECDEETSDEIDVIGEEELEDEDVQVDEDIDEYEVLEDEDVEDEDVDDEDVDDEDAYDATDEDVDVEDDKDDLDDTVGTHEEEYYGPEEDLITDDDVVVEWEDMEDVTPCDCGIEDCECEDGECDCEEEMIDFTIDEVVEFEVVAPDEE